MANLQDEIAKLVKEDFSSLTPDHSKVSNPEEAAHIVLNEVEIFDLWLDYKDIPYLEAKVEVYDSPKYAGLYAAVSKLVDSGGDFPGTKEQKDRATKKVFETILFWGDWFWYRKVSDDRELFEHRKASIDSIYNYSDYGDELGGFGGLDLLEIPYEGIEPADLVPDYSNLKA